MSYSIPFVCLFGIITVFISLAALVLLTTLMSKFLHVNKTPAPKAVSQEPVVRKEILTAILVAIAQETGVDVADIHIRSLRSLPKNDTK